MIATASGQKTLRKQRIIERPRLIKLLTDSKARVLVLVAPAGYGKTTLADQWIVSDGRTGARFRARRSSTDVAALALDLARTASAIVPGCDERLREHLRAVPASTDRVDVLAEILGEDFAGWPSTAWLVIDEYQEIVAAEDAERFVEALIDTSPAQLVVATRHQPRWATQRMILEGELFELTQDDLAMGESEAAQVFEDRAAPPNLLAVAKGWPAAIGLASVAHAEIADPGQRADSDGIRESLYRFFAEEIFGSLDSSVRAGLIMMSIAPVVDRTLAAELLGTELAKTVCAVAMDVGIMAERDAKLELHPLARSFLDERVSRDPAPAAETAEKCVAYYRHREDWDAAVEVIARFGMRDEFLPTLQAGLDDLLDTARISTVDAWCDSADVLGLKSPWISLARAEIALRKARFTAAQTHAEVAADCDSALEYRALCLAGRAAHIASREDEAVQLYRRARSAASTEDDRREAQWCEVFCLIDMEAPEAADLRAALVSSRVRVDQRDALRSAGAGLAYQLKFGPLDLTEADGAHELLDSTSDPMLRSSFLSIYGVTLAAAARYDEALVVATSLIALAQELRLDFAIPFAHSTAATAEAGRRNWSLAETHINAALEAARGSSNAYAEQIAVSVAIRLMTQQGRYEEALALSVPEHQHSLPAGTAEVLASRALALASASRLGEAEALRARASELSRTLEPTLLGSATAALVALKSGTPNAVDLISDFAVQCMDTGALDILLTSYRSAPALLRLLLRDTRMGDSVAEFVIRVGDQDLAQTVGQPIALDDPRVGLSRREQDVFALLEDGLTDRQIATTLFISEATAKRHAHRIYEKLGVHSRREIAFRALLRRNDQATSAIDDTDETRGSSVL